MKCYLDPKNNKHTLLKRHIIKQIERALLKGEVPSLKSLMEGLRDTLKDKGASDILVRDSVMLVPIIVDDYLNLLASKVVDRYDKIRDINPSIRRDADELRYQLRKNPENIDKILTPYIGAPVDKKKQLKKVSKSVTQTKKVKPTPKTKEVRYQKGYNTYGPEINEETGLPYETNKRVYGAKRNLIELVKLSQNTRTDYEDSSSLDLSQYGYKGGVYTTMYTLGQIKAAKTPEDPLHEIYKALLADTKKGPKEEGGVGGKDIWTSYKGINYYDSDVYVVLRDSEGTLIQSDQSGKIVSPGTGSAIYYKLASTAPLIVEGGEKKLVVTKADYTKFINSLPFNRKKSATWKRLYNNTLRTIEEMVASRTSSIPNVTEEQKKSIREQVIQELTEYWVNREALQEEIEKGNYPKGVITSTDTGFVIQDIHNPTPLASIDFGGLGFKPIIFRKEGDQNPKIQIEGMDSPVPLLSPTLDSKPEILNTVIKLLTENIQKVVLGKKQGTSLEERLNLVSQYHSINYDDLSLTSSDEDSYQVAVIINTPSGRKEFTIFLDDRAAGNQDNQEFADALREYFTTPYVYGLSEDGTSVKHYEGQEIEGMVFADVSLYGLNKYDKKRTTLRNKVVTSLANAKAGQIYSPDGESWYYVHQPKLTVQNNLLDSPNEFKQIFITEEEGVQVLRDAPGNYKNFLLNNYSTTAVTQDNKIKQVNPSVGITPIVTKEVKDPDLKPPKSEDGTPIVVPVVHDDFLGKLIYVASGSGKSYLAELNPDQVIDADKATLAYIEFNDKSFNRVDYKKELENMFPKKDVDDSFMIYMYIVDNNLSKDQKDSFYENAAEFIKKEYLSKGDKVVLTGSNNLLKHSDITFEQKNQSLTYDKFNQNENATNKYYKDFKTFSIQFGKEVYEVEGYISDWISNPLEKYPIHSFKKSFRNTKEEQTIATENKKDLENFENYVLDVIQIREALAKEGFELDSRIIVEPQRVIHQVNLPNGESILVYETSKKTSGKEAGFHFLFGFAESWYVKGTSEQIKNDYDSPTLKKVREIFNNQRKQAGTFMPWIKSPDLDEVIAAMENAFTSAGFSPVAGHKYQNDIIGYPNGIQGQAQHNATVPNWVQEKVDLIEGRGKTTQENEADVIAPEDKPGDVDINNLLDGLKKNRFIKRNEVAATKRQLEEALSWFKKSPLSEYISFNTMVMAVNSSRGGAAAQWAIDGITLFHYYDENGNFDPSISGDYSDLYHEAFHAFTQTFLTKKEREELYAEAAKRPGSFVNYEGKIVRFNEATEHELEEFLAEDFRKFMMSGGQKVDSSTPVKTSLWQKLLSLLKELFGLSTTEDSIHDPLGNGKIAEVYNNLKVGNFESYNYDVRNASQTIGKLDKALIARNPAESVKEWGYEDSMRLMRVIDSIIADMVMQLNAANQSKAFITKNLFSVDNLPLVYGYVKTQIRKKYLPELREKYQNHLRNQEKLLALRTKNNIKVLEWALNNFGDVENISANKDGKGVIAYHQAKSEFIAEEDRELGFEDINETEQLLKALTLFNRSGNETSAEDLMDHQVKYMLKSIRKYEKVVENNVVKYVPIKNDDFGTYELEDFDKVSNKLKRLLLGSRNAQDVVEKMMAIEHEEPIIKEILDKLGREPIVMGNTKLTRLWLSFAQSYTMAHTPLIQMNMTTEDGKSYDVKIGETDSYSKKVGRKWDNLFRSVRTKYIISDPTQIHSPNYLDTEAVVKEFAAKGTNKLDITKTYRFLKAIGVNLSDKGDILSAIVPDPRTARPYGIGNPSLIFDRIVAFNNEKSIKVTSVSDIFRAHPNAESALLKQSDLSNYNKFQQLEAKYSDDYTGLMQTNAEGNVQFEQSLHNSITMMTGIINSVESYWDLMQLPYMQYLNIEKNPWIKASYWLNKMFDMDNYDPNVKGSGKRNTYSDANIPYTIEVTNLSGASVIDKSKRNNEDKGTASSKADRASKIIIDFHLLLAGGRPELMRHADKSSSYSAVLSNQGLYVDSTDFTTTAGMDRAYHILVKYLVAEVKRIKRMKALAEQAAKGTVFYDSRYLEQGQKFIAFESVITDEKNIIKDTLLGLTDEQLDDFLSGTNPDYFYLSDLIKVDFGKYFKKQRERFKRLASEDTFYIDQRLIQKIKHPAAEEILMQTFVVNNFIHNIETSALIYGDPALYNHFKEEFHKRNAGAGSTGITFSYDPNTLAWVNSLGEKYAESLGYDKPYSFISNNAEINTAVLQDKKVKSHYYDNLLSVTERKLNKKYANKLSSLKGKKLTALKNKIKKEAKSIVEPYFEMEEGDGQGWITFDMYRQLSILENEWSDKQEKLYHDMIAGKKISDGQVYEFFPAKKFQYWGALKTAEDQMPLIAFHKFSLMPLIPSLVGDEDLYSDRLTNLGRLHIKMIKENIGYALFRSGSKISTINKIEKGKVIEDSLYVDDKSETREFNGVGEYVKNTVFLPFLKDQLKMTSKYKGKVTFPTQMRKLIENNMMEGGVPTDFMMNLPLSLRLKEWKKLEELDAKAIADKKPKEAVHRKKASRKWRLIDDYERHIRKLTNHLKDKLRKELNIEYLDPKDPSKGIKFNEKLKKFIIKELKRQDLSDHEIDFIREAPGGNLSHDLSISLSAEKLERVLTALVVRKIVKQKFNGEALVQFSVSGMEDGVVLSGKLTKEQQDEYGTNGLRFYTEGKHISLELDPDKDGDVVQLKLIKKDADLISAGELTEIVKNKKEIDLEEGKSKLTTIGGKLYVITYEGERVITSTQENVEDVTKHVYKVEPYNTDTRAMQVKIALQGDFENLLYLKHNDGELIETRERLNEMLKSEEWLNKGRNRDMITIVGPRIPVQGLNSMEFAEVVEFLPKEAGNIVVLPSEIVAKSGGDFDIDKITFIFPNIGIQADRKFWKSDEAADMISDIAQAYPELDFSNDNIDRILSLDKEADLSEEDAQILGILANNKKLDVFYYEGENNEKGLQNNILRDIRKILSLEDNYFDLIRPNDTNIVKPIADNEMGPLVTDRDYKEVEEGGKNRIAGTTIFEYDYNLDKHQSNNIGMKTLGLGAIGNTYNAVLNRVGAYMNKEYFRMKKEKVDGKTYEIPYSMRVDLLLNHNTIHDGNISLSHLYDVNNENSISDIINQLMNGWVDIAKDAWIFKLQGNSEITPALLFLIQAGVPVRQAVYFVSQPVIRDYVEEQRLYNSTFADVLNRSSEGFGLRKWNAMSAMLDKFNNFGVMREAIEYQDPQTGQIKRRAYYSWELIDKYINKFIGKKKGKEGSQLDFFKPNLNKKGEVTKSVEDKFYEKIANKKELQENYKYDKNDLAVLLHFIEIDEMAKSVRNVTLNTNWDTSRSNTLFEAMNKIQMYEEVKEDGKIPMEVIEAIEKDSPIGSFYIQDFQLELFKDLFKLRNNPILNDTYMEDITKRKDFYKDVDKTFGNKQTFSERFRNDFAAYMFQNYFHRFDVEKVLRTGSYKGVKIDTNYKALKVKELKAGIFAKNVDGELVFYVDTKSLNKQWKGLSNNSKTTTTLADGKVVQLAALNKAAFPTPDSYYKFVFERELLRAKYPGKEGLKVLLNRSDVRRNLDNRQATLEQREGESDKDFRSRIATLVYEEALRDMALDNTFNYWKIFSSGSSMADRLLEIMHSYPSLLKNYSFLNNIVPSVSEVRGKRLANIVLKDLDLTPDKIQRWHENLLNLSDPVKINVDDEISIQERERIAQFFKDLSIFAFLQSGMTYHGQYALTRIVPQKPITNLMIPYLAHFNKNLNENDVEFYYQKFVEVNSDRSTRFKFKNYVVPGFNPGKEYGYGSSEGMLKQEDDNYLTYVDSKLSNSDDAKSLALGNQKVVFINNGAVDDFDIGRNKKGDVLMINALTVTGNVIPIPVLKGYRGIASENIQDVTVEEAQKLSENLLPEHTVLFNYNGKNYPVKLLNGNAVDVQVPLEKGVAMTPSKKSEILKAFTDAQNKQADITQQQTAQGVTKKIEKRGKRILNDADLDAFRKYMSKTGNVKPERFFTANSTFKEFYNPETGKREKAPQNTIWILQPNGRYDLVDQESGEVYIENTDLETGYQYSTEEVETKDSDVLKYYVNHSGGALGADTMWDEIGAKYGMVNNKHYYHGRQTSKGNISITDEQLQEGISEVKKTYKVLGRPEIAKYYSLHGRNWYQVKNSDAVFAISSILSPGERDKKGYATKSQKPVVEGGTGYAVEMAIQNNKTVYVFNQRQSKNFGVGWYRWNSSTQNFEKISTPALTKNFAGIGTREINEAGKQAIEDVYKITLAASTPLPLTVPMPKGDTPTAVDGKTVDPMIKFKIDSAIAAMKQEIADGKMVAFPESGIGQGLRKSAPVTFLYLSQQLYNNFGYVNPGYQSSLSEANMDNVVAMDQGVSDQEVRDAMMCFFNF